MRRVILLAAAVIVASLFGATSASAESNDTPAGASGPILSGGVYEGVIATENDVDWWIFYAASGTQTDIALKGLGPEGCFGPVMQLVDVNGQVLAETFEPAERFETKHILRTVGPGTFYVRVEPYFLTSCGFGPEARYWVWINASPVLLSGPPPLPPPPTAPVATAPSTGHPSHGSSGASDACQQARARMRALGRRINQVISAVQRRRLRAKFRQARAQVHRLC